VEAQYLDDPHAQFVRKIAWLKWTALIETVSYSLLLWAWLGGHDVVRAIVGSLHGMIWLGFVAMLLEARRPMNWTWAYTVFAVATGPLGALVVFERIRREGVPEGARVR
jgi:hypothetical protein